MRDLQQPGVKLTLKFRMKLTGAAEAALWTNHESHSVTCTQGHMRGTTLPGLPGKKGK